MPGVLVGWLLCIPNKRATQCVRCASLHGFTALHCYCWCYSATVRQQTHLASWLIQVGCLLSWISDLQWLLGGYKVLLLFKELQLRNCHSQPV
jgi:hypothetical protein